MPEYTGAALVANYIYTGGTVGLNADYRSIETTKSIGLVEATAGSDTNKSYLSTVKDGKYTWNAVAQTAGTVLETALVAGTYGTLIIQREGTATGKPKETCPVWCLGASFKYPYDNVVEISCEFQANGAAVISAS